MAFQKPACRHRVLLADYETPLSVFAKLAQQQNTFLFESVEGGEKWSRYCYIGLEARAKVQINQNLVQIIESGSVTFEAHLHAPLGFLDRFHKKLAGIFETPVGIEHQFSGGLVGFFSYDTIRYLEPKIDESYRRVKPPDPIQTPEICLMICEELAVFDNLSATVTLITHEKILDFAEVAKSVLDAEEESKEDRPLTKPRAGGSAEGGLEKRLDELEQKLVEPLKRSPKRMSRQLFNAGKNAHQSHPAQQDTSSQKSADTAKDSLETPASSPKSKFESSFGQHEFEEAVRKIQTHITEGNCMQVVPSQRLTADFYADPIDLYRSLRQMNPSPYMYFLDHGDYQIVGSSPEVMARLQNRKVTVRPIAGTRKRGANPQEDLALEEDLLADEKELAEHVMLIDLGRNDVGRISEPGTVCIDEKMTVERYSHVMHLTSSVSGTLGNGLGSFDVLAATLPAGTLSGAPKVAAMRLISELEPVSRGIYGGAVGYLSWQDNMDLAIAIRTAVIKDQKVHVQAGAGIVADSVPQSEWEETMNKASALIAAATMVQDHSTELACGEKDRSA